MTDCRFLRVWFVMILVLVVAGCGSGRRPKVKTVKVSGVVRMDDQPLGGAEVNFFASEFAGIATTSPDGQFELDAQTGENTVYIRKFEAGPPGIDPRFLDSGSDAPGGGGGPKQLVPAKYSDPTASELRFTVPDRGASDANFDLKSR